MTQRDHDANADLLRGKYGISQPMVDDDWFEDALYEQMMLADAAAALEC